MRRASGFLRWIVPGLMLSLVPIAASGQSLEDRETEYLAALQEYQTAVDARDDLAGRFYALLDSLSMAREAEDQGVVDQLEGRVRGVSLQLQALDAGVGVTGVAYEESRDALLVALDTRLDSLQVVAESSEDLDRRQEAGSRIVSLRAQYAAVEVDNLQEIRPRQSVAIPNIRDDPRDTPETLLAKAELLRSKAEDFQVEIDAVDQALERYRRAVELDRLAGDARSTIDRFGDTQVPVRSRPGSVRGEEVPVADTTGVALESLPPSEAIRRLEIYHGLLVDVRDRTLLRARDFEDRARRIFGSFGPRGER